MPSFIARFTPIASVLLALGGCGDQAGDAAGTAGIGAAGIGGVSAGGAGAGAGGAAGAAGSAAGSGSIAPSFASLKLVLQGGGPVMPCAAAPCHGVHGMAPPAAPLQLPPNDDALLYQNLTTYVSRACGNLELVAPGNPGGSALLMILSGPCGKTPRMPYGCKAEDGNCIPDEYIAALRQWITAGAPR